MKKTARHLIAEVPRRPTRVELTIGIDLGDVWSHLLRFAQDRTRRHQLHGFPQDLRRESFRQTDLVLGI
jgi:hypothetical protein